MTLSTTLIAGALCVALAATEEKPRLAVLDLAGADAAVASALTQAITTELTRRNVFEVVSSKEIATLLGIERQKQLLGCAEESASCTAELAGALGARFMLSGQLTQLGQTWQLDLQTLDTNKARPIGRSTRIASSLDDLRRQLPYAVAEATATPAPPEPSRVGPAVLVGLGGAAVVAGGVVAFITLQREAQVNQELALGASVPQVLKPRQSYEQEHAAASTSRTLALGLLCGGLVSIAGGVVWWLLSGRVSASSPIALWVTHDTFALAGTF